jgi:uncharacterized heparinase superfamily protein
VLKAALYYHTVRHLRPAQIIGRFRFWLQRPALPPPAGALPLSAISGPWADPPAAGAPRLTAPGRVRFLNVERALCRPDIWQAADAERLWLYNLHYFDDLAALDARGREAWHRALIDAWISDNPAALGVGWEAYPISRRVVNWIKWAHRGNDLGPAIVGSLAQQIRLLETRIEWHLRGNHLLANAKALAFGGLFFSGAEADRWLARGAEILVEQFSEQILPDGGHFERSPMYHAAVLEDILDLLNMVRAHPQRKHEPMARACEKMRELAPKMMRWLRAMCHPDGGIAFFNDAAFGIAPAFDALERYANALDVRCRHPNGSIDLASSGYARLQHGDWCVFFDAAPVGPDYQPGHAHADTLAFELSVGNERVITNSGTSTYEAGAQRDQERSTRAHNTVEVDGENSSEVWASFRVARRARPIDRRIEVSADETAATCAHDGYRRLTGTPIHRRSLKVLSNGVHWTDRLEGTGEHHASGHIPLHPGTEVEASGLGAGLKTAGGLRLQLQAGGVSGFSVTRGTFAEEFGLLEQRPVLVWEIRGRPPFEVRLTLTKA